MSDAIDQWHGHTCPACGTPHLPENRTLVLYFETEADQIEFATAVKTAYSKMKAYTVNEFTPPPTAATEGEL